MLHGADRSAASALGPAPRCSCSMNIHEPSPAPRGPDIGPPRFRRGCPVLITGYRRVMELTIANVWPGAELLIGKSRFQIAGASTPDMELTSPRGVEIHGTVFCHRVVGGVLVPSPGLFRRSGTDTAQAYRIGSLGLWGYAFSGPDRNLTMLAMWTASSGADTKDMPQTHAIEEVESVLNAGGDHETAAFQAALGHGVTVKWDLRPFPPFTRYVVGGGWEELEGYWRHQAELLRARS